MNPTIAPSPPGPLVQAGVTPANILEGLEIMFVGLGVVFLGLIMIWLLLIILKTAFNDVRSRSDTKPSAVQAKPTPAAAASAQPAPAPAASAPAAVTQEPDDTLDTQMIALITAAVAVAVRRPFQLRKIRLVQPTGARAWAEQGRATIHRSHRLRKG